MRATHFILFIAFMYLFTSCTGNAGAIVNPIYMNSDTTKLNSYWEKVESLEKLGHVKDMAVELEKIIKISAVENLIDHEILASYKLTLIAESVTHGVGWEHLIPSYEVRVNESTGVVKALNQIILANMYLEYGERNAYRTVRSDIERETEGTYKDWSLAELQSKAFYLFRTALEESELKRVKVENISRILSTTKNSEFSPTLYDVVVQMFINKYSNSFNSISSVSSHSIFESADLFAERPVFLKLDIPADTTDYDIYVLHIIQKYYRHLEKSGNNEVMAKLEIDRLNRVRASSQLSDASELYFNALRRLVDTKYNKEGRRYILNQFLEIYTTEYSFENYWDDNKAIDSLYLEHRKFYDSIIREFEGDELAAFAKAKKDIEEKAEMALAAQATYGHKSGILFKLEYKNVSEVSINLRKLDNTVKNHYDFDRIYSNDKKLNEFITRGTQVYETEREVPLIPSFRYHSADLSLPGLDYGLYLMEVEAESIYGGNRIVKYALFQVTDMQAIFLFQEGLRVVNRVDGQAVKDAEIRYYSVAYNADLKSYNYKKTTDKEGIAGVQSTGNYNAQKAEIVKGKDSYVTESFSLYRTPSQSKFYDYMQVFTDRSIYRPGQMVYFKAVVAGGEGNSNYAVKNEHLTFHLYDTNGEKVSTLNLKTDEYGAVTGSFALPSSGLPGRYSIRADEISSVHYISVEEYKRPKFEVKLDKPDTRLILGETAVINGEVMAYAGYPIASANVIIKVNRREYRYPYYYFFYPMPTDPGKNIFYAELKTDDSGKFSQEILFEASSLEVKQNRSFYYDIEVQVTDQAGESHNADMSLVVGTRPLRVDVNKLKEIYSSDAEVDFHLKAVNSAGEAVATAGSITVLELEPPKVLKYSRFWSMPDTILMSEADFEKEFPHLKYKEDRGVLEWKEKKTISTRKIEVAKAGQALKYQFSAGVYRVKVKLEDAVENEFIINVLDDDTMFIYEPEIKVLTDKELYQSKDVVSIDILRPKDWHAYVVIHDKDGRIIEKKLLLPGESNMQYKLSSAEEDIRIVAYSLNEARTKTASKKIKVLNNNHRYKLEVVKIDDVVKPGDELKWTFRLVDADGNPVRAAGFATLYDKSLDALKGHSWSSSMRRDFFRNYDISSLNKSLATTKSVGGATPYGVNIKWKFPTLSPILDIPYYSMVYDYAPTVMRKEMAAPVDLESMADADHFAMGDMEETTDDLESEDQIDETAAEVRENLNELVFFEGEILTDDKGEFTLDFTMNDALTEWKLMIITHDKELYSAQITETVITQKELMIQEQFPRFFREKDEMSLKATIIRTDGKTGTGTARLELRDALTGELVNQLFDLESAKSFEIGESGQAVVSWAIVVPGVDKVPMVEFILSAEMDSETDAVKNTMPVVTNRKFITEAIPLFVAAESTGVFELRNYAEKASSGSLENYAFRLDYVPNPVWEAIKAMPAALSEERVVSSLMENYMIRTLALKIIDENPQIKPVFEQWKRDGDLVSNLERNQELKMDILSETPWVRAAQSQTDRMHRIAHLFNLNQLAIEQNNSLARLGRTQNSDGGWPWIEGGQYSSWYVTMMVLDYFADIRDMREEEFTTDEQNLIDRAIKFIDAEFMEYWNKYLKDQLHEDRLISGTVLQYLRIRSLYANALSAEAADILKKVADKLEKDWMKYVVPSQVYIGLGLRNYDPNIDISALLKSIDQQLVKRDEMGAYYKGSYFLEFYAQSVPLTVAMMNLFNPVEEYHPLVDEFKVFLLSNKRTNDWGQSSASMKAIYGLLYYGDPIVLDSGGDVEINWGGETVSAGKEQAGTGAFSVTRTGSDIDKADYSTVSIDNKSNHISWGGLYWQYFEDMDKVMGDGISEEFPISIAKNFYRVTQGANGPVLKAIKDGDIIKVGDEITVQINIRVDRSMDFIHVKDDRIAGTEPLDVLSGHKFQYGMYYYQVTRDLTSDFYFSTIRPGQYNLEYSVVATHEGTFSAGLAQAQSYYAPEFESHSEGRRVVIRNH